MTYDDATSPLYARLELIQLATSFQRESVKSTKSVQNRYKRYHDRHIWFAPISKEGNEVYLDSNSLLPFAIESSAANGFNMFLARIQGPYKVISVNHDTLCSLRNGLENTVSICRATLAPILRRYCDRPYRGEEGPIEENPCSNKDSKETQQNFDNLYVVDKIV